MVSFILAGHDWGALVAWAFALAHPEAVSRLIIVNVPHPAIFARELRRNPAQQRASQPVHDSAAQPACSIRNAVVAWRRNSPHGTLRT